MAINVADNFSYKGGKPLDARIQASTVAAMVATPAADLYDGCFAYVTGTKKYYSYDSTNTSDPTLGKWREFQQGGGGGASALDDLTDVDLTSPSNNQVLKYNSQTGKWENANESGGGGSLPAGGTTGQSLVKHSNTDEDVEWFDVNKEISFDDFNELTQEEKDNGTSYYIPDATVVSNLTIMGNRFDKANIYTDTERMIGSWMGKPLYQKTITISGTAFTTSYKVVGNIGLIPDYVTITNYMILSSNNDYKFIHNGTGDDGINIRIVTSNGDISVRANVSWSNPTLYLTIQYTKTTDSAIAIGTDNDYSTDEQIVGTWIDGKPLYQKTVNCGAMLSSSGVKTVNHGISNFGRLIWAEGQMKATTGAQRSLPAINTASDFVCIQTVSATQIAFVQQSGWTAWTESYVTLYYTKTTD